MKVIPLVCLILVGKSFWNLFLSVDCYLEDAFFQQRCLNASYSPQFEEMMLPCLQYQLNPEACLGLQCVSGIS